MFMPLQLCPCTFIPRPHPLHNWNEHLLFMTANSTSVIPAHSCVCVFVETPYKMQFTLPQLQMISVTYSEEAPRSNSHYATSSQDELVWLESSHLSALETPWY